MKLDSIHVGPLALAVLFFAGAACRSTSPVPEGAALPFHVALIPTEIHDTTKLTATPSKPVYPERAKSADDDMRLELGSEEVSKALQRELARAFVRTTLLELPPDAAQVASWGPAEHERYWQAEAHRVGADLLLRTRLMIDPKVSGDRNEKFWLNVPLWLMLWGPLSWFVSDRTYEFSARLQAEVFDTSQDHASLAEYALLPIPIYAEFQGTDMTLIARADDVGDYALSILIPAGLLARETEDVEETLEERLPLELGRQLVRKVFAERAQFEQNLALGAFELEIQAAILEPRPDGRVRVRLPVKELPGSGRLHRYELVAGDRVVARNFPPRAASGGAHVIEEEMEMPPGARFLTVRVVDTSTNTRSYTLRVER